MKVVVPMYRIGQNLNGLVLTRETIVSFMERFMNIQKKVPCYNSQKQEVGQLTFIDLQEDIVYFHIELDKQYREVRSRLETFCQVEALYVS